MISILEDFFKKRSRYLTSCSHTENGEGIVLLERADGVSVRDLSAPISDDHERPRWN
jgi:hypothetical protein